MGAERLLFGGAQSLNWWCHRGFEGGLERLQQGHPQRYEWDVVAAPVASEFNPEALWEARRQAALQRAC